MIICNGSTPVKYESVTLYAFDDHSLPNRSGLRLSLVEGASAGGKFPNPAFSQGDLRVLARGPPGAPDDMLVIYYGNVFKGPDGLLWMYYLAAGKTDPYWKVCRSPNNTYTPPCRSPNAYVPNYLLFLKGQSTDSSAGAPPPGEDPGK